MAGALPEDMSSEDDDNSDRDYGPPDPHDDDDFGHGGGAPAQARPLDPLARFIQELEDLSSMNGPDISLIDLAVSDGMFSGERPRTRGKTPETAAACTNSIRGCGAMDGGMSARYRS